MKRFTAMMLILCMLLSLAACGQPRNAPTAETAAVQTEAVPVPTETEPETEAAEEPQVQAAFPVEVTDHAGRTVVLNAEPQRIVSGYYISTSAIIALGLADRMVGIEAKANKRAIYRLSAPELMELPSVGTAKEFDLEGCIALEPELVVLPLRLKSAAETLEQLEIPVLLVNPESQRELNEMMHMIALAAGVTDRAGELAGFIGAQEALLDTINGDMPTVYMGGNSSFLSTAGDKMYQADMIRQAGGVNAASEIEDAYWVEISYEQLLTWNPDYILLASDASYTAEDVLNDPNLAQLDAVVNGRVLQMPGNAEAWDSPVPGGTLGSVWLASRLHGDVISPEQALEIIDSFYSRFYGFVYSES